MTSLSDEARREASAGTRGMMRQRGGRHARRRALLRTGLLATAVGGAMLGSAGGASAEIIPDDLGASTLPVASGTVEDSLGIASDATAAALGPAFDLQLNPMANTTTDPLSNSAGTQVADFRPVSTSLLTGPLADGASLGTLPGEIAGGLTGVPAGSA